MNPFRLYIILWLFLAGAPAMAQTGMSGTSGEYINYNDYINYARSAGGDLEIGNQGYLEVGPLGQFDVYGAIINNGSIEVDSGGVLGIYGDMNNNAAIILHKGATVNYFGHTWINSHNASVTDGSPINTVPGGDLDFIAPRPAVPSDWLTLSPYLSSYSGGNQFQYSDGGNIPMDIRLRIQNSNSIYLKNTATRIEGQIQWDVSNGNVILDSTDFILTTNATQSGFKEDRYAITRGTGHYVKENYSGNWIFPVGIATNDYTPAAITNSTVNGLHVNVHNYATAAAPRTGLTGIDRTWNIYADHGAISSIVDLEHNTSSNQSNFLPALQFVTRYVGVHPNNSGDKRSKDAWENNLVAPGSNTGTLTSGAAIANASERSRTYTSLAISPDSNAANYTKASPSELCINIRAYLEGALMSNGNAVAGDGRPLMRDNLRNSTFAQSLGANSIPVKDPYEFATTHVNVVSKFNKLAPQDASHPEFQQVTDSAGVFGVSGQNAIVDWAFVELRNKNNSANVMATRAALIQRDGDIVDVDGVSCLSFPGIALDSYYVAVRHRSHLGIMSKYGQSISNLFSLIDLSVQTTPLFDFGNTLNSFNYSGLAANNSVKSNYQAMWAGDFNVDKKIKFDNPSGDDNVLLFDVLNATGNTNNFTNYNFAFGYFQGDYNMDGKAKYDNPGGDDNLILFQILNYPLNVNHFTNFNFFLQQLP